MNSNTNHVDFISMHVNNTSKSEIDIYQLPGYMAYDTTNVALDFNSEITNSSDEKEKNNQNEQVQLQKNCK